MAEAGLPVAPSPTAGLRRLRKVTGKAMPWQFYVGLFYERTVYATVFGGIAVQLALSAIEQSGHGGAAATVPLVDLTGVAVVVSVLAFSVLLKALLAIGPINASTAMMTWLLGSPVDRRRALLGRYFPTVLVATLAGLLWPSSLFLVAGSGIRISGATALTSGATAAACVGFAVCVQASRRAVIKAYRSVLTVVTWACALVLLADVTLGGIVLGSVRFDFIGGRMVTAAAVAVAVVAFVLVVAGVEALGRLQRSALTAGRAVANGLTLSVTSFEFGLLGSIMTERRAIETGSVRSLPVGHRSWLLSLVTADLVRLSRAPGKLLTIICLLFVPALFDFGPSGRLAELAPAVFTLTAFLVADRLAGTQRIAIRSTGVSRMLGLSRHKLSAALAVVPLIGTAVWCCLAAALAGGLSIVNIVVAVIGSTAVVYRISTRKPLTYDQDLLFDFGAMGPVPFALIKQLSRGPTLLLFLMLLQTTMFQP